MAGGLRVAVFGGTGCVGTPLSEWLAFRGHEVTVLSRGASAGSPVVPVRAVRWRPDDPAGGWLAELGPVDAVFHLARPALPGRLSDETRRAVEEERTGLARTIVGSVRSMDPVPRVFVCGSSHDVYGGRDSGQPLDESAHLGTDFYSRLHRLVELEAQALETCGVRVVLARLGVVLGVGGNDPRLLPHVVADPSGALSWVHISDAVEMLERVLVDDGLSGPVNMVAPEPTTARKLRDRVAPVRREHATTLLDALLAGRRRPGADVSPLATPRRDVPAANLESQTHWADPAALRLAGYRWRVTSISEGFECREDGGEFRTAVRDDDVPVCWTEIGSGYPLVVCSAAALPYGYWRSLLGFLSIRYRILFVHPRGLWDGPLPADPRRMSVADHAADVSFLVRRLGLDVYGIVGHCTGVPTVLASLSRLPVRPRRALLVSARLGPGPALADIEAVVGFVHRDARFRAKYAAVGAAYAPPELRQDLERQLTDARRLDAHVRAVQSAREFACEDPWPDDVSAALAWASTDQVAIRSSMRDYAARLGRRCLLAEEFDGDHFAFVRDVTVGGRLVETTFGDDARAAAG